MIRRSDPRSLVVRLLPAEPEPLALLALIRIPLARWPARLDSDGQLVLLEQQSGSHATDACLSTYWSASPNAAYLHTDTFSTLPIHVLVCYFLGDAP